MALREISTALRRLLSRWRSRGGARGDRGQAQEGERTYLCAFASGDERTWLVLDDAAPVTDREAVRRAATIAAMCELADESAGGGELDELRDRLMTIRLTESPDGIEEAEEAALALQQVIGAPPRSAGYLDRVGAATRRLELALGDSGQSPFAEAMKAGMASVEEFAADVESHQATARLRARGYRSESWKAFHRRRPGGPHARAPRIRRTTGRVGGRCAA